MTISPDYDERIQTHLLREKDVEKNQHIETDWGVKRHKNLQKLDLNTTGSRPNVICTQYTPTSHPTSDAISSSFEKSIK